MSSAKTIAKNTCLLFSTDIFDKIISFLLVIIITRYLGSVGFGKYSFAFAFIGMFTMLSHMGLTTYILREISRDRSQTKKLVNNTLTLKLSILVGVYIIAIITTKYWPKTNEIILAILLVMVHEFFGIFNTLVRTIFNAYEKNQFVFYGTIIEKILALPLSFYVLSQSYGLYGLLIALILARFVASVFYYIVAQKKFVRLSFSIDLKFWGVLLKNSLPFWFTMIFRRIYYSTDTIMLTAMKNYAVTGWYNAASTLIGALTFIPTVIIKSTFPAMSRLHHTNSKDLLKLLYKKSFYYLFSIALPISIGISLLAQRLILFIYKEQFIQSGIVLMILSWALIFIFATNIIGYLLNSINKQHLFTISAGVCAVSNVVINLILIPKFSYIGASIATVITQVISFSMLYYFAARNGYPINLVKVSYKPIIAGIVMGALILYTSFLPVIYIIPIAAISYFIALYLIGGIGKEEINLIKSFLPKKS